MVLDDLDEAADVVVSGGDIDTAEAAAIQQISEYNEHLQVVTRLPTMQQR